MESTPKIKVILIDDSTNARNLLRMMLSEFAPNLEIIGEADNGQDGFNLIEKLEPDAIFLDIEMPGKSGLQLAEELIKSHLNCSIIFTTAYNQYAIKAFRFSAIDYLLKPISEDHLIEAVEKLNTKQKSEIENQKLEVFLENLNRNDITKLFIPTLKGMEVFETNEIIYIKASGAYTIVVCDDQKEKLFSKNLRYFETLFEDSDDFFRVHRSTIINMTKIKSYQLGNGSFVILNNDEVIDISRDRKATFKMEMDKQTMRSKTK